MRLCKEDGCPRPRYAFELCERHYRAQKLLGALPATRRGPKSRSLHERFFEKVNRAGPIPKAHPELGPCWLWLAGCGDKGYGRFKVKQRTMRAYKVAWELINGPVPEDMELHHLCEEKRCVNPGHLEPLPKLDHIARHSA